MQADEAFTLLDLVIATIGVILTMAMLTCLCCLFMKISDLKLKCYIIETAKKKGIDLDIDKLDSRASYTLKDETCAIMIELYFRRGLHRMEADGTYKGRPIPSSGVSMAADNDDDVQYVPIKK